MAPKKTLQVIPTNSDYVVQAHALSRSAYMMSVMQRRVLHLAIAQAQINNGSLEEIEMTIGDVVRALGMTDQGNRYEEVRNAVRGLMEHVLDVDTSEGWVMYHWVDKARYIKTRDAIQIKLADDIAPFVRDLKDMWRIIPIRDLTRLQGKYSYRLFELVMADRGFEGKGGNKPGIWFTDLDFADLRILFKLKKDEYKATNDFRRYVIDAPVREINEAGMGIRIECDYERFRRRRSLLGVRLICELIAAGSPKPVGPATRAEKEEAALLDLNRELYERLLAEEPPDMFGGELGREANAYQRLLKHPDLKKPKAAKAITKPKIKGKSKK